MLNLTCLITMETFEQPVSTSSHLLWSLFDTFMEHILLLALFNPFPAAKEEWIFFLLLLGILKFK